jgi:outer membrane lipoprotein SlyB
MNMNRMKKSGVFGNIIGSALGQGAGQFFGGDQGRNVGGQIGSALGNLLPFRKGGMVKMLNNKMKPKKRNYRKK